MLKQMVKAAFDRMGYVVVKKSEEIPFYPDVEQDFMDIYERCKDYTYSSIERMYALYKATEYVVNHEVPGDIVECGVWKGGSIMICAFILKKMNQTGRKIYLYDTYEGMTIPSDKDVDYANKPAQKIWDDWQAGEFDEWNTVSQEEVKHNVFSTGYPQDKFVFVKGKVEETIPGITPDKISILRLDTDWYESTYHELGYLFPKLSVNGVIIIDDYGHWRGAREATDKYFAENNVKILLNRIDYTGRIGIKV